jgi:hypothetical protein
VKGGRFTTAEELAEQKGIGPLNWFKRTTKWVPIREGWVNGEIVTLTGYNPTSLCVLKENKEGIKWRIRVPRSRDRERPTRKSSLGESQGPIRVKEVDR